MNFQSVLEQAIKDNGISYSINYGDCNPSSGYMVSKFGCETISESLNLNIVINYVKLHLDELVDDKAFLGIWLKDGNWYLDVSFNILELDKAIKFGKKNKQLAIWDCANCEEITL
jgi:hypothetical protein